MGEDPDTIARWQVVALSGSFLAILGAFLPWLSVQTPESYIRLSSYQQQGLELVGETTVLLGGLVVAFILFGRRDAITQAAVAVPGLVLTLLPVLFVVDPGIVIHLDQLAEPLIVTVEEASSGGTVAYGALDLAVGLYVTLFGGLLVLVGGITGFTRGR